MRRFNVEMRHEQDDHNVWHTELEEIECDGGKYVRVEEAIAIIGDAWNDGAGNVIAFFESNKSKSDLRKPYRDFLKSKGIEP